MSILVSVLGIALVSWARERITGVFLILFGAGLMIRCVCCAENYFLYILFLQIFDHFST